MTLKQRKNEKRKSTSLKQPVSYSTVRIPNGFYYFIKPVQLMLLWMFNYIKIEATEFFYLIKKWRQRLKIKLFKLKS